MDKNTSRRYKFHFVGSYDSITLQLDDESYDKIFNSKNTQSKFIACRPTPAEPGVIINIQNVTYIEEID